MSNAFKALAICSGIIVFAGISVLGGSGALGQGHVRTLFLHNADEISDANAVNVALSSLVADAATCNPHTMACVCSFKASVSRLRGAYRTAVARHPAWGEPNTGVEYTKPSGAGTVGIVMSNVKREIDSCDAR